MAYTQASKTANRLGLNVSLYALSDTTMQTPLLTIDFANVSTVDLSGGTVWATGGQKHGNKIAFSDPFTGTITISTQIMTTELLNVIAGGTAGASSLTSIEFKNTSTAAPSYYILKAETVWQLDDGTIANETITCHKVTPERAYNIQYSGEGDPTSVDVTFDMLEDSTGKVMTVLRAAPTP